MSICEVCETLEFEFNESQGRSYDRYSEILDILARRIANDKIELLFGDCELSEALEIFHSENYYTINHYLKCKQCMRTYYVGACIRGMPVFKVNVEPPSKEIIEKIYWGRKGSIFGDSLIIEKR